MLLLLLMFIAVEGSSALAFWMAPDIQVEVTKIRRNFSLFLWTFFFILKQVESGKCLNVFLIAGHMKQQLSRASLFSRSLGKVKNINFLNVALLFRNASADGCIESVSIWMINKFHDGTTWCLWKWNYITSWALISWN